MFDTNVRMKGTPASHNHDTKERLLSVAEGLFAEKGFHGVSVREITAQAQTHLSAVNYHFGSKEKLYLEVFRQRFVERAQRLRQAFKALLERSDRSVQGVIRALAEAILCGPLSERERIIHYRLLVRELTEPSPAFEIMAQGAIIPFVHAVQEALRPYFPKVSQERLLLAVLSLFAQVLYFNFARPKVMVLTNRPYDEKFKQDLVEHIVAFSQKGLEGLA